MGLRQLLHPTSVEEFFADYWEQRHLHVTREANPDLAVMIQHVLTMNDVDELLSLLYTSGPVPFDAIRMGQDGVMLPRESYLRVRSGGDAEVDIERVLALHRAGASIILNGVHAALPRVSELCHALSDEMGQAVLANLYITPGQAQGFPVHFDSHDVLLIQVAGAKTWRLAESTVPLATSEPESPEQLVAAGPESLLELRQGELLYLPRGTLHSGVTASDLSAHLTLGILPFTWADLIRELLPLLESQEVDLRRSVPVAESLRSERLLAAKTLDSLVSRLAKDPDVVDSVIEQRLVGQVGKIRYRGHLSSMHTAHDVGLDTSVRIRPDASVTIEASEDTVRLLDGLVSVTLPAYVDDEVRALCSGEARSAGDLPGALDDDGRLTLVRRLLRCGVLVRG